MFLFILSAFGLTEPTMSYAAHEEPQWMQIRSQIAGTYRVSVLLDVASTWKLAADLRRMTNEPFAHHQGG